VGKRPIAESAEATPRQHSPAQAPATPAASVPETQPATQQPAQHRLDARPIQEAQAALNLAGLSDTNNTGGLDALADLLLANADQSVLNLMARGSADNIASGNISTMDAQSLRAMKAQLEAMTQTINSRLRLASGSEAASTGTQRAHARTSAGTNSPALSEGTNAEPIKNEGAEHDLPTPATIAADSGDMNTGMLGKSSPANDSAMDLD
jgi:transcriptional regulatory protein PHF12/RCO1